MKNTKDNTSKKETLQYRIPRVFEPRLLLTAGPDFVNRAGAFLIATTFVFAVFFFMGSSYPADTISIITQKSDSLSALVLEKNDRKEIFQDIKGDLAKVYSSTIAKFTSIFFAVTPTKNGEENTIVMYEDRYEPDTLVIQTKDTVTFKTKSDKLFWPASSVHPDHEVYPEFDSRAPIEPGNSWSFTFDKAGSWKFHDHLRPFLRGEIIVVDEGKIFDGTNCIEKIKRGEEVNKKECWEFTLSQAVEEGGVTKAFEIFTHLYESDPQFASDGCHWYSHKIGDASYADYLTHKDFSKVQFPDSSSYCGYGYYHGFLEHYLRDTPDFEDVVGICNELIKNRSEDLPRIRLNCFHAIGHGFVQEPSDTGMWGDAQAFVQTGIDVCRKLEKDDERMECLQGAFNVISDWIYTDNYGLEPDPNDPMKLCRTQANYEETLACYYELSMKLNIYTKNGLLEFYNLYVKDIEDDEIADVIIGPLVAAVMQELISEDDHIPLLYECRSLPERVQVACLKGITGGFVAHGEPTKEYVKAITFCSSSVLTSDEKSICYWNIMRTFRGVYMDKVIEQICPLLESEYQYLCEEDYGL